MAMNPDIIAQPMILPESLKVWDRMSDPLPHQEGATMETAYPLASTVIWVTVTGVRNSRRNWTYRLSEDEPGSQKDESLHDGPLPAERLCQSYPELCVWLYKYGCLPPSPDYFTPTHEEAAYGVDTVLRRVQRSHDDGAMVSADFVHVIGGVL